MAKYFKLANSHEEAVEYWKASQFDLSDITHREKSREDIIAEAEAAAFAEA